MIREKAWYYDGLSSARHQVELTLTGNGMLRIRAEGIERDLPVCDTRLTPALARQHRSLYLEGGGKCDIDNGPLAQALERRLRQGGGFFGIHRWENSLRLAAIALGLTMALVWLFFRFAIPLLADRAARVIPPQVETTLGTETLALLDRAVFAPSALPEPRRAELAALFEDLASTLEIKNVRLELRASPRLGPNALALPSGIIVLTDELTALADNDRQLTAVLAHELGHLLHRHALRQVLQSSASGLLLATLTGDLTSISSFGAALPTLLVNARYSREMENEADLAAADYLRSKNIPTTELAQILEKLEQWQREKAGGVGDKDTGGGLDYFSTHPAVEERIKTLSK